MTIVEKQRSVTGGVDTHMQVHVAAAVDEVGGVLGVESFPTTEAGYAQLVSWLGSFGTVQRVGVEHVRGCRLDDPTHFRQLFIATLEGEGVFVARRIAQGVPAGSGGLLNELQFPFD